MNKGKKGFIKNLLKKSCILMLVLALTMESFPINAKAAEYNPKGNTPTLPKLDLSKYTSVTPPMMIRDPNACYITAVPEPSDSGSKKKTKTPENETWKQVKETWKEYETPRKVVGYAGTFTVWDRVEKYGEGVEKTAQSALTSGKLARTLRRINEGRHFKASRVEETLSKAKWTKISQNAGKVTKVVGKTVGTVCNVITIIDDGDKLATVFYDDNYQMNFDGVTNTAKVTDGLLTAGEFGIAVYGVGAVLVGATPAGWVAGAGIAIVAVKDTGLATWVVDNTMYGLDAIGMTLKDGYNWLSDWWNGDSKKNKKNDPKTKTIDPKALQTAVPLNHNCYKPNIYIYTDEEADIKVEFLWPDLLTKTLPEYQGAWEVTANGDGMLSTADGEKYGYLFYESATQERYFQSEEGWLISAATREEQYRSILSEYGFNETEISDFVEYWVEKLPAGVDYVMYPQMTETVDTAMPVTITPEPDHITRIWFVYRPYNGQKFMEAKTSKIPREGYTVVEWGGIVFVK